jgi:hypothetical protein
MDFGLEEVLQDQSGILEEPESGQVAGAVHVVQA